MVVFRVVVTSFTAFGVFVVHGDVSGGSYNSISNFSPFANVVHGDVSGGSYNKLRS